MIQQKNRLESEIYEGKTKEQFLEELSQLHSQQKSKSAPFKNFIEAQEDQLRGFLKLNRKPSLDDGRSNILTDMKNYASDVEKIKSMPK